MGKPWFPASAALSLCMSLILLSPPLLPPLKAAAAQDRQSVLEMSLEELMNVEVTSVSKKRQKISEAPAAVFVITHEDLRRSGVTSIPDALRMVPGMQVAQVDANKWSVSARGSSGMFSKQLLVLIDGRSVYTPLFSGVFWDVQDLMLEDVDRIEVIRGPGATLWGANAVNGIINIITKDASKTQGLLATAGGGIIEKGFGSVRQGGSLGEQGHYRIYAKYFNRDGFDDGHSDWDALKGGFRADTPLGQSNNLTVQGDMYTGNSDGQATYRSALAPYTSVVDEGSKVGGANLLARWDHQGKQGSSSSLQLYYDFTTRDDDIIIDESRHSFDMDFQHQFEATPAQEIIWGLGYRLTRDEFNNSTQAFLEPDSRSDHLVSAFVQDDISLVANLLKLTLGSKFEWNEYTGFEIQPNLRLLWTPSARQSFWASVARAVRTPSRAEDSGSIIQSSSLVPTGPPPAPSLPLLVYIEGGSSYKSEELIAYELGHRIRPTDSLTLDSALFYFDYDNLRSVSDPTAPTPVPGIPPYLSLSLPLENGGKGHSYGYELAAEYQMQPWWRFKAAYSYIVESHLDFGTPKHQASLRSSQDLSKTLALDLWLRYAHELRHFSQSIPSYVELDARIGWKPVPGLELSLVGRNLLDPHHPEYEPEFFGAAGEIDRSIYAKVEWQY